MKRKTGLAAGLAAVAAGLVLAGEPDGARVFRNTCAACHSERQAMELTREKWEIIVQHMRVRANLTGAEARAVKRYLQDNAKGAGR